MNYNQLQTLNAEGHLVEAAMACSRSPNGWMIEFEKDDGEILLFTRNDGMPYTFKDIDKATKLTKRLGFSSVRIVE